METAIAHMEQIAKAYQQALDPITAATLDKNLGIIDQAIAETRSAVKADPNSVAANRTLFEALKQKVTLLQETIALMNEMRKGNNAGAAQIVEGLNRS
jgi:acetyl-CoA carboxylase alpha subunit